MPDKRRTTMETLTAEQRAFLQTDSQPALPSTVDAHATQTSRGNVAPIRTRDSRTHTSPSSSVSQRDTRPSLASQRSSRSVTQSVTLRLREPIARNLRRASIERSLDYREPYTQQAIADAALSLWLERNGYKTEE